MRVETVNGRHLLCGHILDVSQIHPGQKWAPADGSNREVVVMYTDDDWVHYGWLADGKLVTHMKTSFAFQCRYCLVLDTPEIPQELIA